MPEVQKEAVRLIEQALVAGGIVRERFDVNDAVEILLRHFAVKYVECLPLYNPERTEEVLVSILAKANFARANGVLNLESSIAEISADYPCASTGLKLAVDGAGQHQIFSTLLVILTRLSHTAPRQLFFDNMLWTVGVLCIQAGENPRMLREQLLAFLDPQKTA